LSGGVKKHKGKNNDMSQILYPGGFSSHGTVVGDALAQVLVCRVISEPSEFVLDGFGEVRVLDDRILSHLAREFRIEVGNVQHRFLEIGTRNMRTDARSRGGVIDLQRWA